MRRELKKIDSMKTAEEQYKYIFANKDKFVLELDNNWTTVFLKEDYNKDEPDSADLLEPLGWGYGVRALLTAIGIEFNLV